MKYRKKPVVIEAFQWTGGPDQTEEPDWIVSAIKDGDVKFQKHSGKMDIMTLEGVMSADVGDYIIQGIKGEIYPCKSDIFEATYHCVDDGHPRDGTERLKRIASMLGMTMEDVLWCTDAALERHMAQFRSRARMNTEGKIVGGEE